MTTTACLFSTPSWSDAFYHDFGTQPWSAHMEALWARARFIRSGGTRRPVFACHVGADSAREREMRTVLSMLETPVPDRPSPQRPGRNLHDPA